MRITTSQKKLKQSLNTVERVISRNPSLPILNNVLIRTESGRLKISATNLEIGISYYLGAKIEETGEIAVPARIFSDFVDNLNDEKVTLVTKNNILSINTEKYKTQILGFDPKEFPIIPKIKSGNSLAVPSKVIRASLTAVLDSVAVSEARPELSGVFTQFNQNKMTLAATDSFRLAERIIEIKNKENISFILPRNTVLELLRVLGDVEGDIEVRYGENQVCFYTDEVEVISRLIDGNYPDYKKVIPDKFISRVLIKKEDLEKNARLAGLFSSNIADIKMVFKEKNTTITSKNSDKGEIQVVVDSLLKNEPFEISVNHYYLIDGLKIIPTDNIIIEYTGQGSPLVIRPEHDNKDFVYLIMPLRR